MKKLLLSYIDTDDTQYAKSRNDTSIIVIALKNECVIYLYFSVKPFLCHLKQKKIIITT